MDHVPDDENGFLPADPAVEEYAEYLEHARQLDDRHQQTELSRRRPEIVLEKNIEKRLYGTDKLPDDAGSP